MKHILHVAVFLVALSSCSKGPFNIELIDSPAGANSEVPWLFTDPSGAIHVSWIERIDSIDYLKLSQWHANAWSEPVVITSGNDWFVNWADYPLAVSNGNGKFLAHILKKSGTGAFAYDVAVSHSKDGLNWSVPTRLHDDGKQAEHGFVSFVPYGDRVFVSWLDGRNTVGEPMNHDDHGHQGQMTLRGAVLAYDGSKLEEWELDNRVCDCCQTTAAMTANGPVVIYRDRSETEVRDMSIVRYVNQAWTAPEPVFEDNWQINGCPVNGPRCEAIGNTLAVAWFSMANDQPAVKVAFSEDGGQTFANPIQLNKTEETVGRVDLVLLDEKSAVVSWMEAGTIKVAQVNSNGVVERVTTLTETSDARSAGFPQLTQGEGFILAAWTDDEAGTIRTAILK